MWIVIVAVIMIAAGVGLVYLGAVAKVMPKGLGLFATLPDLERAAILIIILAVIGAGAWFIYPKEKAAWVADAQRCRSPSSLPSIEVT